MKDYNKKITTRFASAVVGFIYTFFAFTLLWFFVMLTLNNFDSNKIINFKWVFVGPAIVALYGFIFPEKVPHEIEQIPNGIFKLLSVFYSGGKR